MMKRLNALDWLALTLVLIGALNWGLVGFFSVNLVAEIFGTATVARVIYALVGLGGLYSIYTLTKVREEEHAHEAMHGGATRAA